jgi:hypothetical protein
MRLFFADGEGGLYSILLYNYYGFFPLGGLWGLAWTIRSPLPMIFPWRVFDT